MKRCVAFEEQGPFDVLVQCNMEASDGGIFCDHCRPKQNFEASANDEIAVLKHRVAELEREVKRLTDHIFPDGSWE